ncbi:MAG: prephenate dehydrogenase [Bacillota bacterium]
MKVGIIGLGLIGGSMALSLQQKPKDYFIYGRDKNRQNTDYALKQGMIDGILDIDSISSIELLFIATPVRTIIPIVREWYPYLPANTLVSDLGSTKSNLQQGIKREFPQLKYIGGHPMAGREVSGPAAASKDLFRDNTYVLMDSGLNTTNRDYRVLVSVLEKTGAVIKYMGAHTHDSLVAVTSHLPRIMASTLVTSLIKNEKDNREIGELIGSGFQDVTRVAAGNPRMWLDIFLTNRDNIVNHLEQLINTIEEFKNQLAQQNESQLTQFLTSTRNRRLKLKEGINHDTDN